MSEPRTLSGRLFQSLGAKCEKVPPPLVDFAILGTTKSPEILIILFSMYKNIYLPKLHSDLKLKERRYRIHHQRNVSVFKKC